VLPANAPAWIDRLLTWLEPFESAFGHVAQRGAFRRYLLGLLSDSPRKSMSAMLARVSDLGDYQAFQHFITSAPWAAEGLWRQLRRRVPARDGVPIFDGTSFPKQGDRSVGVARQYCGALGKIANCQVATTAALWTGTQAWLVGAQLYLPQTWMTRDARTRARIPPTVRFQEKWRHALTLFRQIRAAGFRIAAVLADAEFGDNSTLRAAWHRAGIPYAVGISSMAGVFVRPPALVRPPARPDRPGRPRTKPILAAGHHPCSTATLVASWPPTAWRSITWRNAPRARAWTARFAAHRITRMRGDGGTTHPKSGCSPSAIAALRPAPSTSSCTSPRRRRSARWCGWRINGGRSSSNIKNSRMSSGSDHFEGRSWPGWLRHAALIAVAYAFLQVERQRRPSRDLTLSRVRAILQEVLTAHLFITRAALPAAHAQAPASVTADLTNGSTRQSRDRMMSLRERWHRQQILSPPQRSPCSDDGWGGRKPCAQERLPSGIRRTGARNGRRLSRVVDRKTRPPTREGAPTSEVFQTAAGSIHARPDQPAEFERRSTQAVWQWIITPPPSTDIWCSLHTCSRHHAPVP
jgi:SRSO17 transposase